MISLKKRQKGFTIVELLIVIVVIGILAAIVITTYSGIQAKARNAKRETDIQDLQTQIEAFYSQNNYYPSLGDMNDASWRQTNMPSLDTNAMVDPSSNTAPANAVMARSANNTTGVAKEYVYNVTDSSGAVCGSDTSSGGTDTNCAKYTLIATLENGGGIYTKSNLD